MEEAKWEAFGDVNPLDYGGIWVRKDSDTNFQIVKIDPIEEDPDKGFILSECYVDISDDWIDWSKVIKYADTPKNNKVRSAIDVVSYYGSYQCSGTEHNIETNELAISELLTYGIEVS